MVKGFHVAVPFRRPEILQCLSDVSLVKKELPQIYLCRRPLLLGSFLEEFSGKDRVFLNSVAVEVHEANLVLTEFVAK